MLDPQRAPTFPKGSAKESIRRKPKHVGLRVQVIRKPVNPLSFEATRVRNALEEGSPDEVAKITDEG